MTGGFNLAVPYFGLIFIGFACGKLRQFPERLGRGHDRHVRLRRDADRVMWPD
jgi:hypothetical protein